MWGIAALVMMILIANVQPARAEVTAEPALSVGEEYIDNIYLNPDHIREDYITHIVPSLKAGYTAPAWNWKLDFSYDRRHFARDSYEDDAIERGTFLGRLWVLTDHLFIDVHDYADRTSISAVRDFTQETPVKNQTEFNTFEVNPCLVMSLSSRLTVTTGYQYQNVWYQDPAAIDRIVNSAYGNAAWGFPGHFSLTALARQDRIEALELTKTRTYYLGGARYEYGEQSFLWARAGSSTTDFEGDGTISHFIWDAGLIQRGASMTLDLQTGRTWIEDPYLNELREDRYTAVVRTGTGRTVVGAAVGIRKYGLEERDVTERKYSATADIMHRLTERLRATLSGTIERYEDMIAPFDTTTVSAANVRLDHEAGKHLTLSASYHYTNSRSVVHADRYAVNRALVEIRMGF